MTARTLPAWGLLLAATLVATPGTAHGQDQRLLQRFPAPVASRLGATVDSAGREGLPTEPLVLRALEGRAKGVDAERIAVELSRLTERLRIARGILGRGAGGNELATAAAALQAGMPQVQLAELHTIRGDRPLTAALGAYVDLIYRGTQPDQAWRRVTELARRNAPDGDFVRLRPNDDEPRDDERPEAAR